MVFGLLTTDVVAERIDCTIEDILVQFVPHFDGQTSYRPLHPRVAIARYTL
jgi:hypothetical protein